MVPGGQGLGLQSPRGSRGRPKGSLDHLETSLTHFVSHTQNSWLILQGRVYHRFRIFGPISKSSHMNILSSARERFSTAMSHESSWAARTILTRTNFFLAGLLLKCYNDGDEKIVKCDENLGYRTCFIRYNESKQTINDNFKTISHILMSK